MTVGEALTKARNQAGLSVEDLSERTKIRGTIIRSIEQDDYEACGGDLYVRGYVRAIAGAVGIDAQPLISEYDLGRSKGKERAGSAGPGGQGYLGAVTVEAARTVWDLPTVKEAPPAPQPPAQEAQVPPAVLNATRYDLTAVRADPAPTAYDLPRVPGVRPGVPDIRPAAKPPVAEFAAIEPPTVELPGLMPAPSLPASPQGPDVFPGPAVLPDSSPPPGMPIAPPPAAAATRYDLTAVPEASPASSGTSALSAMSEDLMAAGYDLGPAGTPADANAGTQVLPASGLGQAPPAATPWPAPGQGSATRKNRRALLVAAGAVVVVAVGALGFSLVSRSGSTVATSASGVPSASASVATKASESAVAPPRASATARAPAAASAPAAAEATRVTRLPIASALAFGPDGIGDGDNPGIAANAIAATPPSPWSTQWYATAKFGMLKHGTGLLLDLGHEVTVTTVRLNLSQYRGTDLQLRVGNAKNLGALHVAATASYVGGSLKLALHHPAAARYLLIWFTMLPPDGSGHYMETVWHISVTGRR